jgi:hypothetical protein
MSSELCNIRLRISADEFSLKASGLLSGQIDPAHVSLTWKEGQDLVCYNAIPIGTMSANASDTLALLRSYPAVQYVIDRSPLELNDWANAWKKKRKGPDLCLEIILYGDRDVKASLGKALSNARLYLQHPISPLEGVILENPHTLQFPDLSDDEGGLPNGTEPGISVISNATEIDASIFLEDLEHSEHIDATSPATEVKTSLLEYVSIPYPHSRLALIIPATNVGLSILFCIGSLTPTIKPSRCGRTVQIAMNFKGKLTS